VTTPLVPFPDSWATTSRALHGYACVLGAIPRAHAEPHPTWWHIGLQVDGDSLVTAPISLPGGGDLRLGLSPMRHLAWMRAAEFDEVGFPLDAGLSPNELASEVIGRATALGLADAYDRPRFESDARPAYDRGAATAYWQNLTTVARLLERRRDEMEGPGTVHVWPHHFDMSFEWYGSRQVDAGDGSSVSAQINFGFNVLDEQYLYSSPWPFDETLTRRPLPGAARWHTDGWTGSLLPFDALLGDPRWDELALGYARSVFEAALPTLTA